MKYLCLFSMLFTTCMTTSIHATNLPSTDNNDQNLHSLSGFFRFSFDNNVQMPNNIAPMGLLGLNYLADITPSIYGGFGAYGSITGTQGGLFTVGISGGLHHELLPHWWGDIGMFVGGGGGKSSLTGGGLMLQPHAGLAYALPWGRVGAYYSYIDFPNGRIHSQQVGINLDLPVSFSYLSPNDDHVGTSLFNLDDIHASLNKFIGFQRNDFAILVQAYEQRAGTKNTVGNVQDGTMGLVGAELDHYFAGNLFWWFKTSGAFSGIPNGYMDVLGGFGYHIPLGSTNLALAPQLGVGAGGGGMVETGGGFLVNSLLGIEWAMLPGYSLRVSSGYIWSPQGQLSAVPITGELICHLDVATEQLQPSQWLANNYKIQGWRFQIFNQTYFHPQRTFNVTSPIQLMGVQIDQLFNPWFFMSYQAVGAYSGDHAGGYATGMIGPGIQSRSYFNHHIQFFAEVLVGAGGGGSLALSGGSIIEPLVGMRYAFTPLIGLQASAGELKALRNKLNTPVLNIGLTMRFDTLNQQTRKPDAKLSELK